MQAIATSACSSVTTSARIRYSGSDGTLGMPVCASMVILLARAKIFGLDKVEVKVQPYLFPCPNITHIEMKVVEKLMENEIRQKFNLPYVNANLDNYLLTISGITQTLE